MIPDLSSVVEAQNPGIPGLGETSSLALCKRKLCIHSLAVLSKENAFKKNISGLWSPRQSRYVVHCSSTVLPYHVGFSETFVSHTYAQCTLLVIVCLNPKWRSGATRVLDLELVSKELNHFGVITCLFRQIGGHST